MNLNDARDFKIEGQGIQKIMLDGNIIWPPPAIRQDTGFLKYYIANIPKTFKTSYIVSMDAVLSQQTQFTFSGLDSGINIYATPRDQVLQYKSYNISTEFNEFNITGLVDQSFDYDISNIVTSFIGEITADDSAVYDDGLVNIYSGPDSGINIYASQRDQYLQYKSYNISTEFNAFEIFGVTDQLIDYDNSNIIVNFIGSNSDATAIYDSGLVSIYSGPDSGINIYASQRDQYLQYKSYNISTEFNEFDITGFVDQSFDYNDSNITTSFIGEISADDSAVYDSGLLSVYLGPDAGKDIQETTYYPLGYNSENIQTYFPMPPITANFDFDLVYSYSNIATSFLD